MYWHTIVRSTQLYGKNLYPNPQPPSTTIQSLSIVIEDSDNEQPSRSERDDKQSLMTNADNPEGFYLKKSGI